MLVEYERIEFYSMESNGIIQHRQGNIIPVDVEFKTELAIELSLEYLRRFLKRGKAASHPDEESWLDAWLAD